MLSACAWAQRVTPSPDAEGVYPVTGEVKPAKLIEGAPAKVPEELHGPAHICVVRVVIAKDGKPTNAQIVNQSPSSFDDAAIAAVMQSRFEAGTYKAESVATRLTVFVPFPGHGREAVPMVPARGSVSPPIPLKTPEAHFPEGAPGGSYGGKEEVKVLVTVLIQEDGLPSQPRVVVPAGRGFDEKALEAVNQYRFSPARFKGVPVPFFISVMIDFRK